jgi:hypothetical protein
VKANKQIGEPLLIHKKGSKVVGLHCNPADSDLFISCGNDHMVSKGKDSHDLTVTAELNEVVRIFIFALLDTLCSLLIIFHIRVGRIIDYESLYIHIIFL